MRKILLASLAALAFALGGCSSRKTSYVDTLHKSWLDIRHAITEDGSLSQTDMNIGSDLAVILAGEEATYWSGRLAEEGLAIPDWKKQVKAIAEKSSEFEGGSAAPLAKHLEMLDCLEKAIKEMREAAVAGKQ